MEPFSRRHRSFWHALPLSVGRLLPVLLLSVLTGCGSSPSATDEGEAGGGDADGRDGGTDEGEGVTLTVLCTVDERGRLEPGPATEGAAKLMGVWRTTEDFDHRGDFLVLSGGNSWNGTVISNWFEGRSVVEVMNRMHYSAAVIGRQEFVFGIEALRARASEAEFPLLSSNLRLKATGTPPDFATPHTVLDANGVQVGLVGLTPASTPESNAPANVEAFDFLPYRDALAASVPMAQAAGADVVLGVTNLCYDEILELLPTARQLGVALIVGAYCGQTVSEVLEGVGVVVPGPYFSEYGKVTMVVNSKRNEFSDLEVQVRPNAGGTLDEEVQAVAEAWRFAAEDELTAVVGFVTEPMPKRSAALHNLITDSWLFAYPNADMAHLNSGAVRAGLPAGEITKGAVLATLPLPNNLVELELTGAQVVDCLDPSTIVAGMTTVGGYFHSDGSPMKMDSVYHVLTTDFLWGQAQHAYGVYDPSPVYTNVVYHQPTLSYLGSLGTTDADPLDRFLDNVPRR